MGTLVPLNSEKNGYVFVSGSAFLVVRQTQPDQSLARPLCPGLYPAPRKRGPKQSPKVLFVKNGMRASPLLSKLLQMSPLELSNPKSGVSAIPPLALKRRSLLPRISPISRIFSPEKMQPFRDSGIIIYGCGIMAGTITDSAWTARLESLAENLDEDRKLIAAGLAPLWPALATGMATCRARWRPPLRGSPGSRGDRPSASVLF